MKDSVFSNSFKFCDQNYTAGFPPNIAEPMTTNIDILRNLPEQVLAFAGDSIFLNSGERVVEVMPPQMESIAKHIPQNSDKRIGNSVLKFLEHPTTSSSVHKTP